MPYERDFIILIFSITLIITEIVDSVGFCGTRIREIIKSVPFSLQITFRSCHFTFGAKSC